MITGPQLDFTIMKYGKEANMDIQTGLVALTFDGNILAIRRITDSTLEKAFKNNEDLYSANRILINGGLMVEENTINISGKRVSVKGLPNTDRLILAKDPSLAKYWFLPVRTASEQRRKMEGWQKKYLKKAGYYDINDSDVFMKYVSGQIPVSEGPYESIIIPMGDRLVEIVETDNPLVR